jgi:hypothetical protein
MQRQETFSTPVAGKTFVVLNDVRYPDRRLSSRPRSWDTDQIVIWILGQLRRYLPPVVVTAVGMRATREPSAASYLMPRRRLRGS